MPLMIINCDRCGEEHSYQIAQKDLDSNAVLNLKCLNIKRLPRVSSFRIDFTKNGLIKKDDDITRISALYGSDQVSQKLKRKNEINGSKIWLVHDFDQYFEEIIHAYIIGAFYPVATSCTTLAERLVNLFIIKLRDLYDKSLLENKLKKYIYNQDQNWQSIDLNMKVLGKWGLLNSNQKTWFKELNKIRNRAVHFQQSFDPVVDSLKAIKVLHKVIDSYFSPFERKDILRVFEIPGEIWVRESELNNPFVKAFVLPCCTDFASCGNVNKDHVYYENDALVGLFSEDEFIKQRRDYQKNQTGLNYEVGYKKTKILGKNVTFRII